MSSESKQRATLEVRGTSAMEQGGGCGAPAQPASEVATGVARVTTPGRKDDQGKLRWSLVPWGALRAGLRVLEHGAQRYGDFNWQRVENGRERYFNALQRHVLAWWAGEELDPDSGEPHLAHALCCLLFLLTFEEER